MSMDLRFPLTLLYWASHSSVCRSFNHVARGSCGQDLVQLFPATGLVSMNLLHSNIAGLQEMWISESRYKVTHFILTMPGRTGLYSHTLYFKKCFPHLHFRKILCWQTFAPPEINFKQECLWRKNSIQWGLFLHSYWLQQATFLVLIFPFNNFI